MQKIKIFFKKITIRRMLILIFLLLFNSYAWFIFATRVSSDITTSVSSWDVKFEAGEDEVVTMLDINIDKIYPGMEDYIEEIEAHNSGQSRAVVNYMVREISILGETYVAGEDGYEAEDLLEILTGGTYPFKFEIILSNDGEMIENGRNMQYSSFGNMGF